ncbi:MAG: S1 family peptidase [Microvirga sp.]|nr:S1 family peptidase [Microvirga sp.]
MFRISRRAASVAVAAGLLAWSPHALAVVGGALDDGPLAASTIMVLASNGGVCSGVVVADDVIATAAHCVTRAPEHRAHFRADDGTPVLLEVADILVHPEYDADAIRTRRRSIDLALLRVSQPLPARFEPAILSGADLRAGAVAALGGYGTRDERDTSGRMTGAFHRVDLPVVEPYGPSAVLVWLSAPRDEVRGACEGDSGGPIASPDGAVFAVTTWSSGTGGRACGEFSQGVRLGPQRAWIDAALMRWSRTARWR